MLHTSVRLKILRLLLHQTAAIYSKLFQTKQKIIDSNTVEKIIQIIYM